MFQTFLTKHNSPFVSGPFVGNLKINPSPRIPLLSFPVLSQRTFCFNDASIAAGNGGFGAAIMLDDWDGDNQVISVSGTVSSSASLSCLVSLVRFEFPTMSGLPADVGTYFDLYPIEVNYGSNSISFKDCVTIDSACRISDSRVYVGVVFWSGNWTNVLLSGVVSVRQVIREVEFLQPLK